MSNFDNIGAKILRNGTTEMFVRPLLYRLNGKKCLDILNKKALTV